LIAAIMGIAEPHDVLPRAERASRRALELDEANADAHGLVAVLRVMRDYDWAGAAPHYHRALELNAASPGIGRFYAGWYLRMLGRFEEAVQVLDRVLAQDPLAVDTRVLRAQTLYSSRRHLESEQECRRILSIDSGSVYGHYSLALTLGFQQRFDEASEVAQRLMEVSGRWSVPLAVFGMVSALAGRPEEAHAALADLQNLARKSYVPAGFIALIYAMCGENDAAFEWAGNAIERRDPVILSAKVHPGFDRIRNDSRFEALLQRMNLA
jgi:tetratricopeptide (TPR) repeat protein